jgi:TonB family protein
MVDLRWATLGTSVALHAAVGLAAGGHAATGATSNAAPDVAIPIELLPSVAESPVSEKSTPDGFREPNRSALLSHAHKYPVPPGHEHPHDPSIVHVLQAPDPSPGVAEPSIADAAPTAPPVRFVLGPIPAQVTLGSGAVGNVHGYAATPGVDGAETLPESAVSAPARVLSTVAVVYPPEARAAEIERDVALAIVVDPAGAVVEARPLSHEGYGLEDAAARAVRSYRFSPAQRDGRAVRVRMRWTVQFRLR